VKQKLDITSWLRKEAELIHGFDRAAEAADEIERMRKAQPCVCPKCGGRGTYQNGSFTLKE